MKIWTCGSSPRSGYRNAWTRIKNVNGASRLSNIWNFFGAIQMISCRDWWPWAKPGYITMTRRQNNNQWNGGIAAHPARLRKFRVQKSAGKILAWNFWGLRWHTPHWFSSKGPNYQRGVLLISAGAIEGHFEGKTPREFHQRGSCSCTKMPRHRTCNPKEIGLLGLPVSWSPSLLSESGPVRLPPVPWTEKTIESSPFFFRRGGHWCRGDLVGRTNLWFFFEWLA